MRETIAAKVAPAAPAFKSPAWPKGVFRPTAGTQPPRHAPGATGETAVFTRRGPYGWVRHPIYGAWFLTLFAVPVMTLTQLVFALTSCGYLLIGMIFEERSLLRAAPDSYRSYQQQVRWKLIPGVF